VPLISNTNRARFFFYSMSVIWHMFCSFIGKVATLYSHSKNVVLGDVYAPAYAIRKKCKVEMIFKVN
jgi:hypothetical protein